jgi:hypothetical protein
MSDALIPVARGTRACPVCVQALFCTSYPRGGEASAGGPRACCLMICPTWQVRTLSLRRSVGGMEEYKEAVIHLPRECFVFCDQKGGWGRQLHASASRSGGGPRGPR